MNKFTLSIVVWILISSASIAQVTIGSDLNPMKGALLDLKEFDSTSSDNTTANKGGFDGLLCGFANWNVNTNKDYDISTYWWSNSSLHTVNAYRVSIESDTSIFGANGGSSRNNMLSVRCVKN